MLDIKDYYENGIKKCQAVQITKITNLSKLESWCDGEWKNDCYGASFLVVQRGKHYAIMGDWIVKFPYTDFKVYSNERFLEVFFSRRKVPEVKFVKCYSKSRKTLSGKQYTATRVLDSNVVYINKELFKCPKACVGDWIVYGKPGENWRVMSNERFNLTYDLENKKEPVYNYCIQDYQCDWVSEPKPFHIIWGALTQEKKDVLNIPVEEILMSTTVVYDSKEKEFIICSGNSEYIRIPMGKVLGMEDVKLDFVLVEDMLDPYVTEAVKVTEENQYAVIKWMKETGAYCVLSQNYVGCWVLNRQQGIVVYQNDTEFFKRYTPVAEKKTLNFESLEFKSIKAKRKNSISNSCFACKITCANYRLLVEYCKELNINVDCIDSKNTFIIFLDKGFFCKKDWLVFYIDSTIKSNINAVGYSEDDFKKNYKLIK